MLARFLSAPSRRPAVVFVLAALVLIGRAFALPVGDPIVDPTGNIIANGDFRSKDPEQRPWRWVVVGPPGAVRVTPKQHHGAEKDDSGLVIDDASATETVTVRSEKRIANPGTSYTARAWVKRERGEPASLTLEFWDQAAKRTGSQATPVAAGDGWQLVSVTLAAPDTSTHVTVALHSGRQTIGASAWDDVSLTPDVPYVTEIAPHRRELFVDDYRLDSFVNVERITHSARKSRPLILPTEPWENRAVYIYGTVLHDEPAGTGYRMWYTAYSDTYYLCYATSQDGVHWVKPRLGITEFQGSRANNIVQAGGGTVVYDPDDTNPARRYKLMTYVPKPKEKMGYSAYFSPDGLHWTAYARNPVITYGDVSNVTYDRSTKWFIATTKQRMLLANTSVTPGKQDRGAFVSVSRNFTDWSAPDAPHSPWTLAVEGDSADDLRVMSRGGIEAQIYGMPVYPYESVYIGVPWVFDIMTYSVGKYSVTGDGPIQAQVAASRDLRHWSRPVRTPVLPLGLAGAWDDGTLYTASTWEVSAGEISLYYGGMNMTHGGDTATQVQSARIAKATWRRDGLVSLHNAGDDPGEITTRTLSFTAGSKLMVNAEVTGTLTVEILDANGMPLPGYAAGDAVPVTGDRLATAITWQRHNDLAELRGKPVQLRFHLQGGDLYSYWFE